MDCQIFDWSVVHLFTARMSCRIWMPWMPNTIKYFSSAQICFLFPSFSLCVSFSLFSSNTPSHLIIHVKSHNTLCFNKKEQGLVETFSVAPLCVAYFNQLSGAACTRKLVETLFYGLFSPFPINCFYQLLDAACTQKLVELHNTCRWTGHKAGLRDCSALSKKIMSGMSLDISYWIRLADFCFLTKT